MNFVWLIVPTGQSSWRANLDSKGRKNKKRKGNRPPALNLQSVKEFVAIFNVPHWHFQISVGWGIDAWINGKDLG